MRPAELDCLFESVQIGPVHTKNRFYQVPHCNGMGRHFPSAMAGMREVKAQGGWGVVSTEQCDIHHSSAHRRELRLWDRRDVPYLANAVLGIHQHGALAAIELAHNGFHVANLESRTIPLAPTGRPTRGMFPVHARTMTRGDIVNLRRWYQQAARNAVLAGFDIVYVYASHDMTTPGFFLSRKHNHRVDEYGGTLENRVRLLREIVEDTKAAVGDSAAVALRFGVDALPAPSGPDREEPRAVVELLAEVPDLWDVNLQSFPEDGATSRFSATAAQEEVVRFVKTVTTKPVVGVGRFTSPDIMARMVRQGVLDLIGAARPSIADPFLPAKVETGKLDEIRECIGCNICVAGDKANVPMRCTQNPTMGEEWRRGWHPEFVPARRTNDSFLVVGAGPAGLEAARALGQRGYEVMLVDENEEMGGRSRRESRLPGLGEWARVHEWRLGRIKSMSNVLCIPANRLTAEDALLADVTSIVTATGAHWRRDGVGRYHSSPVDGLLQPAAEPPIYTPDDVMNGDVPEGEVLIFDDDHYYMASVMVDILVQRGARVRFVTPEPVAAGYTQMTGEHARVQRRILESCDNVHLSTAMVGVAGSEVVLACAYTGRAQTVQADALLLVTGAVPNDELARDLEQRSSQASPRVHRVGDCLAYGTIAAAVHSGHLFARELSLDIPDGTPFARETVSFDPFGVDHGPVPTMTSPVGTVSPW